MVTEDERYKQSTQFRLWSFSPALLSSMRIECNSLAKTAITARLQASSPGDPLPPFLTPAEELSLLNFYTIELFRAGEFVGMPTEQRATAAVFFRRFYLTNSLMTYPPTSLLKTCLYFGAKAEGNFMRLTKFVDKFPKTTGEDVLAAEYILCQGIRFAFDVRHPFRALAGATMELRRLDEFDDDRISRAHDRTREILKFSPLITDAYFHYTPSQIMLAALAMVDEPLADKLLRAVLGAQDEPDKDKILAALASCRQMLEKEHPERYQNYWTTAKDEYKPFIKKLRKCRDPDRADLVALQKARRDLTANRSKKAKPVANNDGSVFGVPVESDGAGMKGRGGADPDDVF